jgi:hypothetical protein
VGALARLLTVPLWLVGAGLVVAGAVALLPLALIFGGSPTLVRSGGRALASGVELLRGGRGAA